LTPRAEVQTCLPFVGQLKYFLGTLTVKKIVFSTYPMRSGKNPLYVHDSKKSLDVCESNHMLASFQWYTLYLCIVR